MAQKTLVLYSGGIDSIGMLWRLLHETEDELYVQHYDIDGFWNHCESERLATEKSLAYIKEHARPFTALPNMGYKCQGIAPYFTIFGFYAGLTANEIGVDRVLRGRVANDVFPEFQKMWPILENIFKQTLGNKQTTYEYPYLKYSKKNWYTSLPKELIEVATTCRMPTLNDGVWEECGKCTSCRRAEEAKHGFTSTPGEKFKRSDTLHYWDDELILHDPKSLYLLTDDIQSPRETVESLREYPSLALLPIEINELTTEQRWVIERARSLGVLIRPRVGFYSGGKYDPDLVRLFCVANTIFFYRSRIHKFITNATLCNGAFFDECVHREVSKDIIDFKPKKI